MYMGGYHEYRGGISRCTWGDIMSTVGVFSTMGDTIFCNLSTVRDIMMHVGDNMSTVGVFSTVRVLK